MKQPGLTTRRLSLCVAILLLLGATPARAAPTEVEWVVTGCEEVVILLPENAFGPGSVLVITTYQCSEATVAGVGIPGGLAVTGDWTGAATLEHE